MKHITLFGAVDITARMFKKDFFFDLGWFHGNQFVLFKLQLFENMGDLLLIFGLQIAYFEFSFGFEL